MPAPRTGTAEPIGTASPILGVPVPTPTAAPVNHDFSFDTEVDRPRSTVTVRVAGELDLLHADDLARHLAEITRPGTSTDGPVPEHLVVDLSRVSFLSSRGLSALVETQRRLRDRRTVLRLSGVAGNRVVERVIDLAGLTDHFDIER